MFNKKQNNINIVYKSLNRKIINSIYIKYIMQNIINIFIDSNHSFLSFNSFKDKLLHIDITISNNKYISHINKKWMNKNIATDVLSFPLHDFQTNSKNISDDLFLGDIIISYEYLKNYCNFSKINTLDHLIRLLCHGFLHLLGFDHNNSDEAKKMLDLENFILNKLTKKAGLTVNFFN